MKKSLLLLCLLFIFAMVNAQDPYSRLKLAADKSSTEKNQLTPVKIQRTDPNWKPINKAPIPFRPFELKDKNGAPVQPNRPFTLRNGRTITAKEFIEKLNEIEKKANAQGYTLRSSTPVVVSKTVTDRQTLSGNLKSLPVSIAPLKTEAEVKAFMSPYRKVGDLTLKPFDEYTKEEKQLLSTYSFSKSGARGVTTTKLNRAKRIRPELPLIVGSPKSLYNTDITNTKTWERGASETFQVGIEGKLHRYAKIYPFNPEHPEKSQSEFKVSASGRIWGSLFSHSIDLLNGSVEFYAPADADKKMSAKINIKAAGITLYNFSREYEQSMSFSDTYGKNFDKSFPIEVPIGYGFEFKGKIGIKGSIGFEYGGSLYRSFASVQGKPIAEIDGYAEAGLEFLDIIGGGVGGKLTLLKGSLGLDAFAGIWSQDAEQIVLAISYHFGYDLEMLSGSLYCYVDVCYPDWVPFKGGDCSRLFDHELFEWEGLKRSGTIAEGTESFVLANIWAVERPLLMER